VRFALIDISLGDVCDVALVVPRDTQASRFFKDRHAGTNDFVSRNIKRGSA
jgi:hypothetical protein